MPPNPRFSSSQLWRGGRRVVEQMGPEPALRDGGSMKSVDGGASVGYGGSHVPPMFRWWFRIGVFRRRDPREGVVLESSSRSGVVGPVAIGLA
uniref:Uncharacterized protein n=1 Tax=Oryza barthii TaxID=65489 RepID=A0A0D3GZ35_9ORYZ